MYRCEYNNNDDDDDGLLKYTWWHKNYELQCAYISYIYCIFKDQTQIS